MARRTIPQVIDDCLLLSEDGKHNVSSIQVDSVAWSSWLNESTTRSFAFSSQQGTLTARREHRHGAWYWYAYRTQDGHLHKAYLGKPEELTGKRLQEVATLLSAGRTVSTKQADKLETSEVLEIADAAQHTASTTTPPFSPATRIASLHLLTTKLSTPPPRSNVVLRGRLIEQMNVAVKGPLTLIVAPAGWGKTTLLTTWRTHAHLATRPFAWVSLDSGDNDPLRFWSYFLAALNTAYAGVAEASLELLYTSPPPPIEVVLTALLNAMTQLPDTVLVLDDYHLIASQPIHDALMYLVEHLPANLHLIIASRSDPLLPLSRLRVRGVLTELRAAHLRFTTEEAIAFLTKVMGILLSTEQVAALQVRTEGWIAGLQLAALSMRGRDDIASFITAFTGSHRYVVDYLVEEVLSRQEEYTQDFLLQTCVLDRFNRDLCDVVRGRDDSQVLLEYIERTNLFLVSLDDERQWYRYHHLFAEVLRSRLQHQQAAGIAELHRRASTWYEQHELFDEAVTHALAIPDVERAASLIEQYARFTNFPSQFQVLLGWLNRLPDTFVRTQPSLSLMHGITLMLTHQVEKSLARVQDAERCLQKDMPEEQRRALISLIAAFRANIARLFGDYERCIPFARQALELMPETDVVFLTRMFRPSTLVTAASAYLVHGDMTAITEQLVERTVASVRALGNLPTTMRGISNLARFQLLQGRLRRAVMTIEQATQLVSKQEELHTLLNGADYYVLRGDVLREWNRLDEAEQHLTQGIALVQGALTADAEMIMRGYIALARLHYAHGKIDSALTTLDAFVQMAHKSGFASALLMQVTAVRMQMELTRGNLSSALHWAESHAVAADEDRSFLYEQEYLTLARIRLMQGREKPTASFLTEALALLERLSQDAEEKARMSSMLGVLILRALTLQTQGKLTEALVVLERALQLAEPEGYVRLFLDEGKPMITLLCIAVTHNRMPGYATSLLEVAGEPRIPLHASHNSLLEPLTVREYEVLRLLLEGASNREIAQQLVLSINTVKKHVLNLCGKLGTRSRTQAIAKARTMHLL